MTPHQLACTVLATVSAGYSEDTQVGGFGRLRVPQKAQMLQLS